MSGIAASAHVPASWWSRVGATVIDAIIFVLIGVAGGLALGGILGKTEAGVVVGILASSLLYAPLFLARSGARNGQTPGKQALGIRVVTDDRAPLPLTTAILREWIGKALLGLIPLYEIADVLWPLFDSRNQALHDKVASTFVVLASSSGVPTTPSAAASQAPGEPLPRITESGFEPPAPPPPTYGEDL